MIPFYKYQGTGNDFVMIDQREHTYLTRADTDQIKHLCDRRMGIGADGLILLQAHADYDFEMIYFNADGNESSMCGNGGRCIVAFAHFLQVPMQTSTATTSAMYRFLAVDGLHLASIDQTGDWVELQMKNVTTVERGEQFYYLDTGSPHYVRFVDDLAQLDVVKEGRAVRYSPRFEAVGTNVNFVQYNSAGIRVLTYERGVEDETLSCGTGVTAAAIAYYLRQNRSDESIRVPIEVKGGQLEVRFEHQTDGFKDIWLCGPAIQVFKGQILPQSSSVKTGSLPSTH